MAIYLLAQATLTQCKEGKTPRFPCSPGVIQKEVIPERDKITSFEDSLRKQTVKREDGKQEETDTPYRKLMADRYGKQFIWTFLISINIFVGIGSLSIYFLLAYKAVQLRYILAGLFICLVLDAVSACFFDESPVISSLIKKTIANGLGTPENLSVEGVVKFVNFVADATAIATPFALCAILFRKPKEVSETQKTLLEQLEDLRLVLYVAAILLVVGVLRMSSVLSWSSAFLPSDVAVAINSFFATFTFVVGTAYTVLLAVIYIPAYYILKKRAEFLIGDSSPDAANLLEKFKLGFFEFSLKDSLPRIVAIIAPFLTGTVAEELIGKFF